MKINAVIFNKLKGKRESNFVTNRNNNSWIISDKSPTKTNTTTSPKVKSLSTPDELSITDNSMLTRKKQQPSETPTTVTPKTSTYKAKEVSKKHLFLDDLFLQEEIMLLRKELDNKQRITEALLQQISEYIKPIHQAENTTFNNVINKDVNIKSLKYQSSESPSKLINDKTMEKSFLTKEKINIQLTDVRKESRKRFYESK